MNHEHSSSDSFKKCHIFDILSQNQNNLHFIQYKKLFIYNMLAKLASISDKFYLY